MTQMNPFAEYILKLGFRKIYL